MTLSGAWDYVLVSNDTEKGGILRLVVGQVAREASRHAKGLAWLN